MTQAALDQVFQMAIQHHRAGRLDEAEKLYRQILMQKPQSAEVLNLLGALTGQRGQLDAAMELIRRAIAAKPELAEAHSNLGRALIEKGEIHEAVQSYQQAIRLKPDLAEVHDNLGIALKHLGRTEQAIAEYRHAIRLRPDYADAHNNLGSVLQEIGQLDEAIASHRQAVHLRPGYAAAHNNLGNACHAAGRFDEAVAACREAIRLQPDRAEAHSNLGNALAGQGHLDEAIAAYRQAIRLRPNYAEAHNNLGNTLPGTGHLDEAIAAYRQAIHIQPDYALAHGNLIYSLHFHPGYDAKMIFQEQRLWNQRYAEPLKKFIQPHTNDRDPDRRLRIGYLSPDFHNHVVGQIILPLLGAHDRRHVEVFCYSNAVRADSLSRQIKRSADSWQNIVGLTDSQAADLIRDNRIDILVDLALHTSNNRLRLFARKPAPVQVTYLGYCSSTGMDAMDYRLSDPYLDPADSDLSLYSEQTIRLPQTYWCYKSTGPTPDPSPPPVAAAGFITFGCLNNFAKVSPPALDLWMEILQCIPRSRLIVHSSPGAHLELVRKRFAAKSISPDRIEFYLERGNWTKYLQTYARIDIALDPFPWAGGVTTCDALWMGLPVVSLAGKTPVGRGGCSILSNIGLPELVARTPTEYLQIAKSLAEDLPRLAELRRTLRGRMQASLLVDAPRFARDIEAAYRQMWRMWCAGDQRAGRKVMD